MVEKQPHFQQKLTIRWGVMAGPGLSVPGVLKASLPFILLKICFPSLWPQSLANDCDTQVFDVDFCSLFPYSFSIFTSALRFCPLPGWPLAMQVVCCIFKVSSWVCTERLLWRIQLIQSSSWEGPHISLFSSRTFILFGRYGLGLCCSSLDYFQHSYSHSGQKGMQAPCAI